jgi:DNA-binding MarR family transcriptional regulator
MAQSPDIIEPPALPPVALEAWSGFLRAHAALSRQLDAELQSLHSLTLNDYDVLVQLRDAEGGALRMSDVAERVVLTRSGITRLVDGLQRDGLVERANCPNDARAVHAKITDYGRQRLAEASATHRAGIRAVFSDHFDDGELQQLASYFERLLVGIRRCPSAEELQPGADAPGC